MKPIARAVLSLLVAATALPLLGATASAAPGAPVLTQPANGSDVESNPVFSWAAPAGAQRYRLQVDDTPDFSSLLVNVLTYNTKYGHTTDLPQVTLYWRVAALDAANAQGPFSNARSFNKVPPSGPTLETPADGAILDFPTDPGVLSWEPFPGAKDYQIDIDTDPGFQAPLTVSAATTLNTSYALTNPQTIGQTFYWRVRARSQSNLPSQYSEVRAYSWSWDDGVPTLTYPPNDSSPVPGLEEVVFEWEAVPGATTYKLQASPNDLFTTLSVNATVHSTRYSPPATLNNGAYYWRVQPLNAAGATGAWSDIWTFYRAWPAPDAPPNHRVSLLSPADQNFGVPIPRFEWSPVRLASHYELWLGTDPNFSPGTYQSCKTDQTTYVPLGSACRPAPSTTYYWQVRPIDGNVIGLWSDTFTFQHNPGLVALSQPADGSTVVAPVELRWNAVNGVGRYRVVIKRSNGTIAEEATTHARSYVPQNLNPADGPGSAAGSVDIPCVEHRSTEGWMSCPRSSRRSSSVTWSPSPVVAT